MDSSASDAESDGGREGLGGRRGAASSGSESGEQHLGLGSGAGRRRGAGGPGRSGGDRSTYGVFADDDSPRPGRNRKRKQPASKSAGPISFIKGVTLNKQPVPEPADKPASDDEDNIDPRFRFDRKEPPAQGPVEQGPKLPARNKLSFGQMSVNYGKGFAMMQKMGFEGGGIGRRNDGIANPIEVLKRKDRQGLQEEGELHDQDLYGHDPVGGRRSVEELLSSKDNKGQKKGEQLGAGWRKGAASKKPRTVHKTAAEVAQGGVSTRIIDMRGPEVHIAASFSELAASLSGESVKSLKELRYNMRKLVGEYEDKINKLAARKKHYEDVLLQVAQERKELEAISSLQTQEVQSCHDMLDEIGDLRASQDQGSITLEELGVAFGKLRDRYPKQFEVTRAVDVAAALAAPVAQRDLAVWRPLEKPEDGFAHLAPWRHLMKDAPATLEALCKRAVLPRLRGALCEWPVRDAEPCIRLMETCRKELPAEVCDEIVVQLVLPRLSAEIEAWDPRIDKMAVHVWIHPWLPTLGNKLSCLWAPIRFKLSAYLERWKPADARAHEILRPWKLVFDASNWEPLIEKVLTKLETALAGMSVRPDGQDVGPIKSLSCWTDLVPAVSLARMLEAAFFPHWHAALRDWLRVPGCDYGEVLQWYQGWKAMLPEVLREQGPVQKQFAHGLEVMKHVMSGNASGAGDVPPAPTAPPTSPGEPRPPGGATSAKAPAAEDVSLSLCDYLADVAGEKGFVFRPKPLTHLGKQVYQFGAVSIYLDKNLVYAAQKGNPDNWQLVSLDEVLKLAATDPRRR